MLAVSRIPEARRQTGGLSEVAMIQHLHRRIFSHSVGPERFHALFLSQHCACLGETTLASGGPNNLSLRMRDLFARALSVEAAGMVVAHNHPSGNCRPSVEDMKATKRLRDVGKALDIELLDHLIFTREKVYSMRAGGKL